jgi:hypothetical protein
MISEEKEKRIPTIVYILSGEKDKTIVAPIAEHLQTLNCQVQYAMALGDLNWK